MNLSAFAAIFDEHHRILLVRMAYGNRSWTTPGGGVEAGETIAEALKREVLEETGYHIDPRKIIGVYFKPIEKETLIFVEASIIGREEWHPNEEISEVGFFSENELPLPMNGRPKIRIRDAFAGERGILRTFEGLF